MVLVYYVLGYLQYLLLGFVAILKIQLFTGEDANVCTPEDMMNLNLGYESQYSLDELFIGYEGSKNKFSFCKHECNRTDYVTKITSGYINQRIMNDFINKTGLDIHNSG